MHVRYIMSLMMLPLLVGACSKTTTSVDANPAPATQIKRVSAEAPITVVATTGMVGDVARGVGGALVQVTTLMGPGVDPHLYKASQGDIARLANADIIMYNGLNLEGKMGDIFVKMARNRPVVAVTEAIDHDRLREPPEFLGHFDPHLWFNVALWSDVVPVVAAALADLDPAHRATYEANAAKYVTDLQALHVWTREQLSQVPVEQRVLVTAHDAFGYFGDAYSVDVVGLQGISTVAEFGLKDIQRIVDTLVARKIKAVFVESSIPRRSIEAVVAGAQARGHDVVIGGELFSDAMGAPGTEEGTYLGMVRANVNTIVDALSGRVARKE
jgi:manganese/zinc/iron transport system substrate-binding protein